GSIEFVRIVVIGNVRSRIRPRIQALRPGICHAERQSPAHAVFQVRLQPVIGRTASVGLLLNYRESLEGTQGIRLCDRGVRLSRTRLELVDVLEMLQVQSTASHIAERSYSHLWELVFSRQGP